MQRIEAIDAAHDDIAAAPLDDAPLVDAPLDADPLGPYQPGEDLAPYMAPHALIDAAIADMVAIQDAASHAGIDGPASAQCSC